MSDKYPFYNKSKSHTFYHSRFKIGNDLVNRWLSQVWEEGGGVEKGDLDGETDVPFRIGNYSLVTGEVWGSRKDESEIDVGTI